MRVLAQFVTAATDPNQFPAPLLPEVAFLGRSNVGKSSVINSLIGSKVARTSATPGRTRSINFIEVRWPGKPRPELVFTDLPGYGYARVPQEISRQWPGFIEPYLRERPSLVLSLALIDINIPSQASDRQILEFLNHSGRPALIIGTKSDRLSSNQLRNSLDRMSQEYPGPRVIPYSARTGAGRDELWAEIRAAVGNYRELRQA
jgi:GTP-binding protein